MKRDMVVELFSEPGKFAVIRLPGRAYPGVVVQGDSLWSLVEQAHALLTGLRRSTESHETVDEAVLLCEALENIVNYYERCLADNGLGLPYVKGS